MSNRSGVTLTIWLSALLSFAPFAEAQTTLNLSATGEVDARPDQVVATVTAQVTSYNPGTAQNGVNAAIAAGLALAKAVPGVVVTTANYGVSEVSPDNGKGPDKYQASEDLYLVMPAAGGVPSAAFGEMLGKLQEKGFLLGNFDGDLSAAGTRAAQNAAIADAMGQIKSQAQEVGDALGEKIARIATVNLNMATPVMPEPAPMMAMAQAKTFAPPQAAPANVSVQASVTATVELAPK